jgi:RNA polymerase sigma-70 factor (ECF subfamily)
MEALTLHGSHADESGLDGLTQIGSAKFHELPLSARFEAEALPHLPILRRVALKLLRNESAAEDLVQETFAQALKSFDSYQSGTNCRGWLFKIMFYKRSQWIRSNSRFCQFPENEWQFPAISCAAILPADFVSEKLALALFAIPDKFQQIIRLSILDELTYREISVKLDIPIGTVMSRLHRGRKMLRENFSHFTDKPTSKKRNN